MGTGVVRRATGSLAKSGLGGTSGEGDWPFEARVYDQRRHSVKQDTLSFIMAQDIYSSCINMHAVNLNLFCFFRLV